jgi:hypothetical protein
MESFLPPPPPIHPQDKDDEDEDLEHGKAHDDMWALDTKTYKVTCYTIWKGIDKHGE